MDEKDIKKIIEDVLDKRLPKQMSDEEKMRNAADFRDTMFQGVKTAEDRTEAVADDFTKLEVTIATLMLGFSTFFLGFFDPSKINVPSTGIILMKIAFSASMFLLFASLACGLMYLKSAESFWDKVLNQRFIRFKKWNQVSKREVSFEEAKAYHEGTTLELGNLTSVPPWTWILQTVFLGSAISILLVLVMVYLFAMPVAPTGQVV